MTTKQFVDYIEREIAPLHYVKITSTGRATWRRVLIRNRNFSHYYDLVLNFTSLKVQMEFGYLAHQLPTTWRISVFGARIPNIK